MPECETATERTSTQLVAVLLPLLLLVLSSRVLGLSPTVLAPSSLRRIIFGSPRSASPPPNSTSTTPPSLSLARALRSYAAYPALVASEIGATQRSYARLPYRHKQLGWAVGYPRKLEAWRAAEGVNARVARGVVGLATGGDSKSVGSMGSVGASMRWWAAGGEDGRKPDVGRVREALKHFVRDWSAEGAAERARIFRPILGVLGMFGEEERKGMKVLVPGSGLGRLAWEVSELGYDTTAIELSYFMTLAFRFLLSPKTTHTPNQHIVHPYAHWFSHSRSAADTLRGIAFPDVVPRRRDHLRLVEGDFLAHGRGRPGEYDCVVTLFFIDTSLNAIATLEHIYALLKPGGTWINLGPLLWTGGAQARVELSLEEVVAMAGLVGFEVSGAGEEEGVRRRRTVECEYTADGRAMMRWLYQAEFWVARRPASSCEQGAA